MASVYQRIAFLLVLGCALVVPAKAQKEVLYYQYQFNPMAINPAYAGNRETMHLTAMFRRKMFNLAQGQGFRGGGASPVTQSLAIDGAVADAKIGLGLQALNDRMSTFSTTGIYASAAYWMNLPNDASLSVGATGGVSFLPVGDLLTVVNKAFPSVGFGVYYQSDTFFGGVSMPEFIAKEYQLAGRTLFRSARPLFVQLGTKLQPVEDLLLYPSVLVTQAQGRPLGTDFNAKAWYREKVGVGLSYRRNSLGFTPLSYLQISGEYQLTNPIRLGITYNTQTPEAPVNTFQRGVVELLFRYTPNLEGFTF
ncbi:PorP/SprF family type IX secretion system membrane protein [Rudanella lutea]|uniref:PorP/SprF family type IX secretion system membrane protein n=1 Tax=Rudanella lutea TaxID=451374 RepID=UPI00037B5709|nr:PorP/SprF family type IX secretion system membrane protein [Rudanella lutea]